MEIDSRFMAFKHLFCASLATLFAIGFNASAQSALQITPQMERDAAARSATEQRRSQEREKQQRELLDRSPDVRLKTPEPLPAPLTLPVEKPCFVIRKLELKNPSGIALTEFDWVIQQLTSTNAPPLLGECVGALGVAWVIDRAQKMLIERGLVTTRVLASQQDMSAGTLALTVIVGRIRAIRLLDPVDERSNLWSALPMRAGDLLNLRDVEQALENLKRVPTAEADIQIEPAQGDGAQLGESDLVVTYRQGFPFRLTVSADDGGTKSTGKFQGSTTVSVDNALGLNDLFYFTGSSDLGGGDIGPRGSGATVVHYSLPFGNWIVGTTRSTGQYYQKVVGLNGDYVYSGTTENNEIKVTRLLFRDAKQKFNLSMRAFQRKSKNYIDDLEVYVQRRVVGGWDSTLNHKAFIQNATLESNLTYKRGTGAFGSLSASEDRYSEGTSRFAVVMADVNLSLPFKLDEQRIRYNGTFRLQSNRSALTPQDQFVIGGRYTVRGFDGDNVLSAERGWLLRNDLSFALGNSGHEIYTGLDYGQVSGPSSALLVGNHLSGAVLGVRGFIQKLSYDIFIATPLTKPDHFNTAGSTAGFSLTASF